MSDPVALILPVHNAAGQVERAVNEWTAAFKKLNREFVLIVVDDGSSDATTAVVEGLLQKHPTLSLLRHESRRGFGACLRTALPICTHPIVAYSALDYPYVPTDIGPLLTRLGETGDVYGEKRSIVAVSGARSGPAIPSWAQTLRTIYRLLMRGLFGITLSKPLGWYGGSRTLRTFGTYLLTGLPLQDPDSALKVFRREWLDRFPIQSDGDFVHAEIFSKLTFLTGLIDELPLSPKADVLPPARWDDFWKVFKDGRFHPALPVPAA